MDKLYKIEFLDYDKKVIKSEFLKYNEKIKIKNPKRYFYKFIGWYPKLEKRVTHDQKYIAQYKPINDKNQNGIADEIEFIQIIKEIIENEKYIERKNYKHHGNESVYDHCIEVAYYTYKLSKKLNIDYKSATIAAMLHDFYYNDWQKQPKIKQPLLKKHGFVHAREALENSKKTFPNLMNKKVENSIERHMFPLNIIPPKYLEAWVVTISDKRASMKILKDYKILFSFFNDKYKKR